MLMFGRAFNLYGGAISFRDDEPPRWSSRSPACADESRVLANDDRDAAEQAAVIIIGKWSDPEDQGDSQL